MRRQIRASSRQLSIFFLQKNQCFSSKKHLVIKKPRQVDDLFTFVYKNRYHFLFKIKKKNKKKTNDEKVNIIPLFYYAISELS